MADINDVLLQLIDVVKFPDADVVPDELIVMNFAKLWFKFA